MPPNVSSLCDTRLGRVVLMNSGLTFALTGLALAEGVSSPVTLGSCITSRLQYLSTLSSEWM